MSSASPLAVTDPVAPAQQVTRQSLGDYITTQIEKCSGRQLPRSDRERILDGFWDRFGASGMDIARRAFGAHKGFWRSAPVTILRFAESNDPFFATPLLRELEATGSNTR